VQCNQVGSNVTADGKPADFSVQFWLDSDGFIQLGSFKFVMFAINFVKSLSWLLCLTLSACQSGALETTPKPSITATKPASQPEVTALPTTPPASPPITASPKQPSTPQPSAVARTPKPNPIFRPIFPALKYQTKVPILLPGYVPEADQSNPVFAILEAGTRSKYQILLAFTEDCQGGNACRLGEVSGETIPAPASPLKGETVALTESKTGYFVESRCGANCSDSTLTWGQTGHRYTVAIKAGSQATLIKMANSAIANGSL